MATPARSQARPAAPEAAWESSEGGPARLSGTSGHRRPNVFQRAGRRRRERRAEIRRRRRARRNVVGRHPFSSGALAAVVLLTPIWVSLGSALGNPEFGVTLPARFAEWAREHGAGPVVVWAENAWYSHHQPPVGGKPPKGAIPPPTASPIRHHAGVAYLPTPPAITPFAQPPIPGEGQWHPAGRLVDGVPAVYEAYMRPDPLHTSLVVGVAWMDTKLLKATLYSGSFIPGGGPYKDTAPIQPDAATSLVSAFNAGFLMKDANGGYYTQGKTVMPLRNGAASVVIYKNGSVQVGAWGRDAHMTPDVVSVRQNLNLLVDHGKPVPNLNPNDTSVWGDTLGGAIYVWRSGIGITKDGALVYVGGPGLNITTLAKLLARAGAVRGMELDINTDWVNYATFTPSTPHGLASASNGKEMLPDMAGDPSRYFESWWARDFFTMSAR